jgi:hypothetical protein
LYYLLLYGWLRVLGTSDAALRLFSVGWALACFPVMWSLARHVGGRVAALPSCLLFTFSPLCLFYSTEGRTYSLLWFWTVCTIWLTLQLWRRGFRLGLFLPWVGVGAAGWLTHYFFVFVWTPAVVWLLFHPGRFRRTFLAAGIFLVGLLILPWYLHLPESLANWRVTADWLKIRPGGYHPFKALVYLPWSFLSIRGIWGVSNWSDRINLGIFLVLAGVVLRKMSWSLFSVRRRLLWWWLIGACVGPLVFDLVCGTYVIAVPRYALAGMPAAFLLVGLGLGRLRRPARVGFGMLIVLACLVGVRRMYVNVSRDYEPTRQIGSLLAEQTTGGDLVIVHSIPSGVVGIARYLESQRPSEAQAGYASWVGQLGQRRVPDDLQRLAAGRQRVVLVKIHDVGEPAPEETWLRENATPTEERPMEGSTVLFFVPRDQAVFRRAPTQQGHVLP